MMLYNEAFFDQGVNRLGTNAVKWQSPDYMGKDTVPLWVADMDFPCAEPIREALLERAGHPCYGYTCVGDEDAQALTGFWRRRHGLEFEAKNALMLPTVVTGLRVCVQAMTLPGDGVIIQSPVYGPFFSAVIESGRVVMEAPLAHDASGRYSMDYTAIERHLRNGARLMILCNPHNPVSRAWSQEELRALVLLLKRYQARLVSDEIHADFVYSPKRFIPVLSLPETPDNTVFLAAASKTFNIAGLQQAAAVCRDEETLRALARTAHRAGAESGNIFALAATRAAYTHCDDWLDGLMVYLRLNQDVLRDMLSELLPRAVISPMEATFLAWLDLRAYLISHDEIEARLRKHKVALTSGRFFGQTAGEGFMRINYGCPRAQLKEGLVRLARAVNEG
ncbi:MAG: PatB family C-S lyase [Eubacteriales bacterium]|nr:PatB family C-S lyase [Eubacteriales bacterium]